MKLKVRILIAVILLTFSTATAARANILSIPQRIGETIKQVENSFVHKENNPASDVSKNVQKPSEKSDSGLQTKDTTLEQVGEESPKAIAKYQAERLARGTNPKENPPFTFSIKSPQNNSTVPKQDLLVSWTYENKTKYSPEFFIYLTDLSSKNKDVVFSTDISNRSTALIWEDNIAVGHTYELRITGNILYTGGGRNPYELVDRIIKFKVVDSKPATQQSSIQPGYSPVIISPSSNSTVQQNNITIKWLGMKNPVSYQLYFKRITEPIYTNKCMFTDPGTGSLQTYTVNGQSFSNVRVLSYKIPFPMDAGEYEAYIMPLVPNIQSSIGPSIKIIVQAPEPTPVDDPEMHIAPTVPN